MTRHGGTREAKSFIYHMGRYNITGHAGIKIIKR